MSAEICMTEQAMRERTLRLAARKLSIETLVRVHLECVSGTRQLMLGHQRRMFTLSLGALAGAITLFAAALRLGGPQMLPLPPLSAALALLALAALTGSALLSAGTLQGATRQASRFLREPFPDAGHELGRLFSDDETAIVSCVLDVLERRVKAEPVVEPRTWSTTLLLLAGVSATAAAFAF